MRDVEIYWNENQIWTENAYDRTIRQIATYPLCPESRLAVETMLRRIKAKRRIKMIKRIWEPK